MSYYLKYNTKIALNYIKSKQLNKKKYMNLKTLLAKAKPSVLWMWKNRVNLFISAFFTILLTKWTFGRISTQQVVDALQLINPLNLLQ